MERNFEKYRALRAQGESAREVYLQALFDGFDKIESFRMIREVFSLSFAEAKKVAVTSGGKSRSLEEHQEKLSKGLQQALEATDAVDDET